MLTNKLKSLEKRVKQAVKSDMGGIFFVRIRGNEYVVKTSHPEKTIYQGDEAGFEVFTKKYSDGIFIIDDIPTGEDDSNLFEWVK